MINQSVLWRIWIVVFKVKVTAKLHNVIDCLSRWCLLKHWTFYFWTWYSDASFWARLSFKKICLLSSSSRSLFVGWCFEPSQLVGVTSGLNTNFNLSLSYSAHKSYNINHNISTAQLFQTYTHTKPHIFLQNLKLSISQLKYFSTQILLQNTLYFSEMTGQRKHEAESTGEAGMRKSESQACTAKFWHIIS